MYDYESNISWTIEVYEQLFKAKQLRNCVQDYYASIRGLLTQLELYQPFMIDLITQHGYREELIVDIFLSSLDTLAMTFSSTLRSSTKTPLLSLLVPPPLYHLTLQHFYLPNPRESGTT